MVLPAGEVSTARAVELVRQRGGIPHVLDGANLVNKHRTLDGIAAALSFPQRPERNLDALYDCLTDLSWLPQGEHVLVWSGHDALVEHDPKSFRGIAAVLHDAAKAGFETGFAGRSFSVILTGD